MPKVNDPQCPLGFHPQFRRPNYCKRCFREYNEHKSAKESSSTSINSLSYERKDDTYGSRDSLASSSRLKDEYGGLSRSRSDLTRSSSDEDDRSSHPRRPMSWSAQDLRKAVDEAKEHVRSTREEVAKYYGSTRSLTQDLGALTRLLQDNSFDQINKESVKRSASPEPPKTSSFSSYLTMRTKSPARPPLAKSTSLQGTPSTTSSRLSDIKDEASEDTSSKKQNASALKYSFDAKPPKAPSKLKSEKTLPFLETRELSPEPTRSEKSKKIIQSLREVKSEDGDASYVIKIRPKKDSAPKKVEIDLQPEVERLQKENKDFLKQIKDLEEKNNQLESENKELLAKKPRFGDLKKQTEISKLQAKVDELGEEVKNKAKELKDMKKELDKRPLPKNVEKTIEDLRSKLTAAEQLCEELMDENEDYKKEVRTLEEEIEEMQDNFREEQADEYRDLKRELEQRAKDCRVLQFKLKKAERRSDQLERDKVETEEKLKELQVGEEDIGRAERIKNMEKELSLAKEISMRMHEEMEKMKTQLEKAETDKKKLKEKVQEVPTKPGAKVSRSQVIGRQGSQDNMDQILRDLQDALEREQDIKEQLRYAEEETKNFRKKLSRVEEENETLQLQLNKMSSKAKQTRQRSMERSGSIERSSSVERGTLSRQGSGEKPPTTPVVNGEELDPTEMKIQLELNEQESAILRRKVEDLESENMRLQKELKEILSSSDMKKMDLSIIPDITKDSVHFSKKIRMLEDEASDLRKKIVEYEKEKNQLKVDLEVAKKRARVVRSSSQEQAEENKNNEIMQKGSEALRQKLQEIEDKYDQVLDENKRLTLKTQKRLPLTMQENLYIEKQVLEDKVKRMERRLNDAQERMKVGALTEPAMATKDNSEKVSELQTKVEALQAECNRLTKDNEDMKSSAYGERTKKNPREITPKQTLIKWVNELEAECASLHAGLRDTEKKLEKLQASEESAASLRDLQDKLQKEKERNAELSRQLKEERNKGEGRRGTGSRDEEHQLDSLKKELEEERLKVAGLRARLGEGTFDEMRSAQTEKHKLQKELASSQQTVNVMERKLKEAEETLKISEKAERNLRNLLEKSEQRLDEERTSQSALEGRQKDLTLSWLKEREDLKKEVNLVRRAKEILEKEARQSERVKINLESQLLTERRKLEETEGRMRSDKDDVKKLRKESDDLQVELDEIKDTMSKLEKEKGRAATKQEKEIAQLKKDKEDLSIRMNTLETELKTEKKKRERLECDSSVGLRGKTSELEELREKLQKAEHERQRHAMERENLKEEIESKIKSMDKRLSRERRENEKLQAKCTSLEEKCQEQEDKLELRAGEPKNENSLRREYEVLEKELKTLRETYVLHQDKWIKEKLDLQVQMKELQDRSPGSSLSTNGLYSEKLRLKNIIDDKNQLVDTLKAETEILKDQLAFSRRESEDLRKKVDDLEKLQEIAEKHQVTSVDTKGYESTIKDLRSRLSALEKNHKSETTKMKMRYDTKVKALSEELSTVTQHTSKYRRERDTYKEMLDGAQKTIADLKGGSASTYRTSRADNVTEMAAAAKRQADHQAKAHLTEVQDLQSLVTELEDKLADSRLETTKLRNQLVDQKTNFEIQLADMQTKLNEYEEDRLLGGGGRRVPGLRTRLELNWQKEREEQQRLIQETATLAKDLRQTLYEVERERDMERLESKRKIDQLKRTVTQDHHDTKSKVQELQRDLQELREAHAKLRQINEKLRREKDRTEVEREAMRDKFLGSSREQLNQMSKMEKMLEEMTKIKELAPLVLGEGVDRKDSSLTNLPAEPKPKTKEEFTEALRRIMKTSDELRVMMSIGDDRDRLRRTPSFRRALSTESDDEGSSVRLQSVGRRGLHRPARGGKSQLYRKSQSLDHQLAEERGKIWVSTDAGSTSSIESAMTDDPRRGKHDELDSSLDRISTGSQTSDLDLTGDQKKKNLKGILAMFGKSKSIEDTNTGDSIVGVGLKALAPGMTGSGSSLTSEPEKDTVKGRLKTLFMKSPSSRSQSAERDGPSVKKIPSNISGDSSSIASKPSLGRKGFFNL